MSIHDYPVVVIGAGPVGLAAAVHLQERGIEALVLEAADGVGGTFRETAHVRLFSPWQFNVDRSARRLLEAAGWQMAEGHVLPTAGELVRDYLAPLAALPTLAPRLRFGHRVTRISRLDADRVRTRGRAERPFLLRVESAQGESDLLARAVIDASGNWRQPNPLGAHGIPARGEERLAARIAYGMPDIAGALRARYAGKRVLVVGAGHSAAGNLVALADLAAAVPGTQVVWALRGSASRSFGGGAADQLPARGLLGERLRALRDGGQLEIHEHVHIQALAERDGHIDVLAHDAQGAAMHIEAIDEIVAATGSRPDVSLARELRVRLDPVIESTDALAPLIDPNLHSCGTVRPHGHRELAHADEPGYYAVGAKSYGRAPNFLLATGYEQVRSIAAALAGDMLAADQTELILPETGVCSAGALVGETAGGGCCGPAQKPRVRVPADAVGRVAVPAEASASAADCCGGPPKADAQACCVSDEDARKAGQGGCGCGTGA